MMPGTPLSRVWMKTTGSTEHGLSDALLLRKLCTMLQSISARLPGTKLLRTRAGVGVYSTGERYLSISSSGNWTKEDLSALFELLGVWLRADPEHWAGSLIAHDGSSVGETERVYSRPGACCKANAMGLPNHDVLCHELPVF